jgi:uncharacterized membrane protein
MEWLLILGLIVWAAALGFQVSRLRDRTDALERRIADLKNQLDHRSPRDEAAEIVRTAEARPAEAQRRPAPRDEPVQVPSAFAEARATFGLSARTAEPDLAAAAAAAVEPEPAVFAPPPKPAGPPPREVIRAWLEENGLAWAGGAALALGGLFLVTYAAQRGMFTPPLRIAAAVVTGGALLGASEWLKRRPGQDLGAALAAGAGAATLYGAAWASYWLYDFISLATSGGLLALISLGLLGLAFRHGQPLAVLAILGGFLAPAITGPAQWSAPALTGYLALMVLTGYAVAGARRWGQAGVAALAGSLGWALAGFAAQDAARVAALGLAPFALGMGVVEWRRRRDAEAADPPVDLVTLLPLLGLMCATALLAALWITPIGAAAPDATGTGAAALALLTALASRRSLLPPVVQGLGYLPGLAVLGLYAQTVDPGRREAWIAGLAVTLAAAGVIAATGRRDLVSRFGAAAAGLVAVVLALSVSGPVTHDYPWAPGAAAALLLLAGAAVIARRSEDAEKDLPLAVWIWAAGGGAIYALAEGIDARFLPLALTLLAQMGAALHARLGWRGFAAVMTGSTVAALAAVMSPALFTRLGEAWLPWWGFALAAGLAAALAYAAAWIARRSGRAMESAEAQSTAALVLALAGAGVLLRYAAGGGGVGGGALDVFMEASLRTVLILVAGLTAAQAVRGDSSVIGRWRGQVLLLIGLAHGVFFEVLFLNPLPAWWTPAVAGPPILDSLAVGLLAPAALLAAATLKKVSLNRMLLAAYGVGAGVFLLAWEVLEIRRLFQGASLHAGLDSIGRGEAAAYAVAALAGAFGAIRLGERAAGGGWTVSTFASEIQRLGRAGAWAALGLAVLVFGWGASPWWGPVDRPLAGVRATGLLLALYLVGGGMTFLLAETERRGGAEALARGARLVTVGIAFALVNIVTRLFFRGYDMRPDLREASLETWAFSAVWGLFGFGLLIYGVWRRSNDLRAAGLGVMLVTLAKIFLFDMSRLDGVVRAGSFLAVGALLLGAAVLIRRLTGNAALSFGRRTGPEA